MKCLSLTTRPSALHTIALASRSNARPSVVRASQPRPTTTAVRPGAALVSDTLPPLVRLTDIEPSSRSRRCGHSDPSGRSNGTTRTDAGSVLPDDGEVVLLLRRRVG